MDVYSFGILMWEVLYEKVPFEGQLKTAVEYVLEEDARPLILTTDNQLLESRTLDMSLLKS